MIGSLIDGAGGAASQAFAHLATNEGRCLVWGLVPRAVGLVFLIAFGSLSRQIIPWLGERGIAPVALSMARMREDLPLWSCLRLSPSLLWLARSDRALRVFHGIGLAAAAAMVIGGPIGRPAAVLCWAIWLSLQMPLRLYYPWDTEILEAGLLAIFLPSTHWLPSVAATAPPHPLLPFLFHLLLFRVVFGFGKTKFWGIRRKEWIATKNFFINMPLCTRLGWRAARLPDNFHRALLGGVAFVELFCSCLVFIPGAPRLFGAVAIVAMMIAIQLTGNFGFFNLLTALLCLTALDHAYSIAGALSSPAELVSLANLPVTILAAIVLLGAPLYLCVDTWSTHGILSWPAFERLAPGPLRGFLALLRFVEPLRLVNGYGVFTAGLIPPIRWVTLVEGSDDGREWRRYRYRAMLTDETSRPPFAAPHHPRLDHLSFYDAVGTDGTGYFHSISFADPYLLTPSSTMTRVMQRLLEEGSPVPSLFADNPFPDAPPKVVRVSLYRCTPTTLAEQARTGLYWKSERVGLHLPPTRRDEDVWTDWMPKPEHFHFEACAWRRRARACGPISRPDLDDFFDDLLPFVRRTARADGDDPFVWSALPDLQLAVRRRYTRERVRLLWRTLGRLTIALLSRLDAVFSRPARRFWRDVAGLGAPAPKPAGGRDPLETLAVWPDGPLWSRFHVGLAVRWLILRGGRDAFLRMAGSGFRTGAPIPTVVSLPRRARCSMAATAEALGLDVPLLVDAASTLTVARGFFLEGVLSYDLVQRQASRLRVAFTTEDAFVLPRTGIVPGALCLIDALRDQPALRMISGWGDDAVVHDLVDPPRVRADHEGAWEDVRSGARIEF